MTLTGMATVRPVRMAVLMISVSCKEAGCWALCLLCVSLQGHVTHVPWFLAATTTQIPVCLWGNDNASAYYSQAPPQMIRPDGLLPEASLCMQGPSLSLSQRSQSDISTSSWLVTARWVGHNHPTSLLFHGAAYIHCLFEQTSHIPPHVFFPYGIWFLLEHISLFISDGISTSSVMASKNLQ